ncbi:NAD(P)H-dependent oxidoreductase [Paraburkholderia phenazinium]|uniref:NAD(P)H dehydrogenase (Quinone) n=1 Tax=Paraburkholderia phenazinium TaxID=60549 RepID=A0A1G8P0U4_9BURK|nr:NAD(P)H-dependent oxidoreductase [Paraburkholderia phenazinium]SDI86123.1 NAD(P)H dehydrogenase (quinone) [Paraburkholderia phenazinium]
MKHLVVVAHPVEDSFTMGLARAYTDELAKLGHVQRTCDLYRMGFNPALTANELMPARDGHLDCADVVQAQDEIRAADVLIVFYPLWWMSMPAMMKGYVDRVFASGFSYDSTQGIVHGLLSGKKALMVTCSGAPLPLLVKSGNWNAVQVLQDTHIFGSAGFELIEHLHFDEIVPSLPETVAAHHMERVRSCVRQHFFCS